MGKIRKTNIGISIDKITYDILDDFRSTVGRGRSDVLSLCVEYVLSNKIELGAQDQESGSGVVMDYPLLDPIEESIPSEILKAINESDYSNLLKEYISSLILDRSSNVSMGSTTITLDSTTATFIKNNLKYLTRNLGKSTVSTFVVSCFKYLLVNHLLNEVIRPKWEEEEEEESRKLNDFMSLYQINKEG